MTLLLTVDPDSYTDDNKARANAIQGLPHPIAWCREGGLDLGNGTGTNGMNATNGTVVQRGTFNMPGRMWCVSQTRLFAILQLTSMAQVHRTRSYERDLAERNLSSAHQRRHRLGAGWRSRQQIEHERCSASLDGRKRDRWKRKQAIERGARCISNGLIQHRNNRDSQYATSWSHENISGAHHLRTALLQNVLDARPPTIVASGTLS